ncbi:MAG: glutamate synthase subunit beta [Oscillospiraceae bacterium]|nr:glutamate synthase subunit beta [Oscillospiraceae bacterium]
MGKTGGFLIYDRQTMPTEDPRERVKDYKEFHQRLTPEQQQIQGARCMNCGTPFCQTGMLIKGRVTGCPLHNLIPEWNELVYQGNWKAALERLLLTNPFPEFTGRVCPAPCEAGCNLGLNMPPTAIHDDELAIIEEGFKRGLVSPQIPAWRSGKKVAVIGSGPSGLAAAHQLNQRGHQVTVYERHDRIGGLLMYGIPNMKLDKDVVLRRLDILRQEGVAFVTNTEIKTAADAKDLLDRYDAVVLCCGSTQARDLRVPGRELSGIYMAVDFLSRNTKSLLDSALTDGQAISAKGKDVIIVGGGDTGTDCVGTSLRHGARSVTQFEIMDRPPLERAPGNPWPEWPNVYKLDYGQEENAVLHGSDPRQYLTTITDLLGTDGHLTGVRTTQVKWRIPEGGGRPAPLPVAGTEKEWPADLLLIAMGFTGPESGPLQAFDLQLDGRGFPVTPQPFQTSQDKVFVGGDMRRGQSLVVWGIREGLDTAAAVDHWLQKQ